PNCFSASHPTSAKSHWHETPVASTTRIAASQTSGPTPSPRMTVIVCILSRKRRARLVDAAMRRETSPCPRVPVSPRRLFLSERLPNRRFRHRSHNLVAFRIRVQPVIGQFGFEHAFVVKHLAEIV